MPSLSQTIAVLLLGLTWTISGADDTTNPAEESAVGAGHTESSSETPKAQKAPRTRSLTAGAATSNKAPAGLAAFDTRGRTDQTPQWIDGYDPEYFTLQIISVGSEESAKRLLESIAVLGRDKGYVGYELEGATRYGAFIGIYRRYSDAQRALQQLPPHIQEYKPWIRKVKDVQRQAWP